MNKDINEKKKRYAIIISIITLMICVTGGTYAYFALTASNNSVTGTVGGASLNLTVSKIYPETATGNMVPQLESTLDEAISLDHKCVDDNGNVICQVYSATVTNQGSTASVLNGLISFTGIENMPNLKWMRITNSNTLGTYTSNIASTSEALFEENKSFTANGSETYYFVFWIDETGEVQTDNGKFRANIKFDSSTGGLTSTVTPLLSEKVISLYDSSRATSYNIGGDTSKPTVSLDATSKIMLDNNGDYRYYGASPNNYVSFNNELWRIISVGNVKSSEEDTTGETRVRIIKDTKLGDYAWDDDWSNNWADSTLMCQLNTLYYNDTIEACAGKTLSDISGTLSSDAGNLIDNALWYLGGGGWTECNKYASDYYNMERNNSGYGSNPTRHVAKIGIMYPSDYAYATDLNMCTNTGSKYSADEINCLQSNWLFNSDYQWLISPDSSAPDGTWLVDGTGSVSYGIAGGVGRAFGVRPVAVLKSNVKVTGGNGTSGSPYTLGLSD